MTFRPGVRFLCCLALLCLALSGLALSGAGWAGSTAQAAGGDRVEELREAGHAAFQAKRYADAKRSFDEAFRRSPLHSLGLWAARSRVELVSCSRPPPRCRA
jgi:hypothetical protein